jgi:hypothetical protein
MGWAGSSTSRIIAAQEHVYRGDGHSIVAFAIDWVLHERRVLFRVYGGRGPGRRRAEAATPGEDFKGLFIAAREQRLVNNFRIAGCHCWLAQRCPRKSNACWASQRGTENGRS